MSFKIIPEDAGNTLDVVEQQLLRQDHPRRYGEHHDPGTLPCSACGSSPQMWGARGEELAGGFGVGIIPADAGSTSTSALRHKCY